MKRFLFVLCAVCNILFFAKDLYLHEWRDLWVSAPATAVSVWILYLYATNRDF